MKTWEEKVDETLARLSDLISEGPKPKKPTVGEQIRFWMRKWGFDIKGAGQTFEDRLSKALGIAVEHFEFLKKHEFANEDLNSECDGIMEEILVILKGESK